MNLSWNERSGLGKAAAVVQGICVVVLIAFLVLEIVLKKDMPNITPMVFGLGAAMEAVVQWNHQRRMAVFELLIAICFGLYFILDIFFT